MKHFLSNILDHYLELKQSAWGGGHSGRNRRLSKIILKGMPREENRGPQGQLINKTKQRSKDVYSTGNLRSHDLPYKRICGKK